MENLKQDDMNVRGASLVRVSHEEAELMPIQQGISGAIKAGGVSTGVEAGGVNHLALNCIVPGLGSLVRGKTRLGGAQLGLLVLAMPMFYFSVLLALAMIGGAYIWSIASGIGYVRQGSSMRWE